MMSNTSTRPLVDSDPASTGAPFGLFIEFVRSIALLALPPSTQEDFLNAQGVAPLLDELALQFSDELPLVPAFAESGWMTQRQTAIVASLDDQIGAASAKDDPNVWLLPALESQTWSDIRNQASLFFTEREDG